jgi:hypothetical protein
MKKASSITLSIFIMMIVLGVLLAYTAFYIDQVTLRPVVQMQDAEVDLKCFFVLSNIVKSEYLRESEPVPVGSLREQLIDLYGLKGVESVYLGANQELFNNILLSQYGKSEVVVAEEEIFWNTISVKGLPLECYMRVYGPVRMGATGLFGSLERYNLGMSVAELIRRRQCDLDPEYARSWCT